MTKIKFIALILLGAQLHAAEAVITYPITFVPWVAPVERSFHEELAAIGEAETGNDWRKIGGHGERSAFQMKRITWRQHTRQPFYLATADRVLAEQIALTHLRWLARELAALGRETSVYNLALAWRYGLDGMTDRSNDEYATQVECIFRGQTVR